MHERPHDLPTSAAEEGASARSGAELDPLALPDEEGPPVGDLSRRRAAPIGRPIAPAEYARLKEEAARDAGPIAGHAQEDAASEADDDAM